MRPHPVVSLAAGITVTLGAVVALTAPTAASADRDDRHRSSYTVGLFGDMPYGDYGRAHYPAVIADMNAAHLAFSLFDGDTKNGSEPCYADPHPEDPANPTPDKAVADATHPDVYKSTLSLFARLDAPVIYTPGDNEWTDCDRPSTLGGLVSDSSDRLAYLRKLSYPDNRSLGRHKMTVIRQSAAYPENVRFAKGPVTYLALNIPGSDNNFADGAKNGPAAEGQAEYAARNAANLAWLRTGFAAAKAAHSKGVLIVTQADMWDPSAVLTHYADTKAELFRQTTAFAGRVALVNGDSHSFETTKPLTDYATVNAAGLAGPNVVENFTRVTTFGEAQNHWVSLTVDAHDPNVFTFEQHLIAANIPAYTPPSAP
ncbi:hypothetical protein GCM10020358_67660 [Amorphoplanes nipponensis]|uniref:Calcineurin-like phosphoesterase domain-containing protein n=1 Tax=Actinoplanes nipponensis TaxID=135950 RepID=A0A919JJB8_9ACTN|nr:hypothetical protein [Actinoplanes nipponensis]GIE51611.1 hypothetical protein Ani05nite_51450 [Actinoplanes nipponensis]